ncbi:uncharacterized protein H6S33_004072 [Morchella sextelata]|uniref:uncharacterized protein n=1 Tax=Morchella sextelata TaxID=1174677 RepID=UPI001D03A14E|nr:uncharacterized protein H6S33_004072 [Morchella sextelata]KAH0606411.1 hypothetical protein H6S33_004072 [Morchella sextelata]
MKFTTGTIVAFAALMSTASAHLTMSNPAQWQVAESASGGNQFPLKESGEDYPCPGVAPAAPVATYTPGQKATLQVVGSATHGGGSGQMSITYDPKPNASSKFGVMTSWEGNHPVSAAGNGTPDPTAKLPPLTFTVPKGLPAGPAVVAWTWFNKVGNREMYMRCASVMIGGSEKSTAAFDALPTILRANSGNGCLVPEGITAIKFKNPGPEVFGTGVTPVECDKSQPGKGKRDIRFSTAHKHRRQVEA